MIEAKIFSGTANIDLATRVSAILKTPLSPVLSKRFSDGNIYVRLGEELNEQKTVFMQTLGLKGVNNYLVELVFMLDGAKRAGAREQVVVLPYFSYGKADRIEDAGTSLRSAVCAQMLEQAGASKVIILDVHAEKTLAYFNVPAINLSPVPLFVAYLQKLNLGTGVGVVSPDQGYLATAKNYALALGGESFGGHKTRRDDLEYVADITIKGDFEGKNLVVVDDFTTSGNTLLYLVELLKNRGAKRIIVAVTHCLLSSIAFERVMNAPLDALITTNSVVNSGINLNHPKLTVLDCAPVLAAAIKTALRGAQTR
jgi:ribose-phosphate pyrophosphokinase